MSHCATDIFYNPDLHSVIFAPQMLHLQFSRPDGVVQSLKNDVFGVTQKHGICFVLMTNPSSQGESSGSSDAPRPRRNFDRSKSVGTFLFPPNNETKVAAF
jgi:hypothetical protein